MSTGPAADGTRIDVDLSVRGPFAGRALADFLTTRAVAGIEDHGLTDDGEHWYARTMRLSHGPGALRVVLTDQGDDTGSVPVTLMLADARDGDEAVTRTRRLIDAGADPAAIVRGLVADPVMGPLVTAEPGLRIPGHVDGDEMAVRAIFGQQVSVARARTMFTRLVEIHGDAVELGVEGLTRLAPTAAMVAAIPPEDFPMPRMRARAIRALCAALADGTIRLDHGVDPHETRARLLELPGIGPWTADYIRMRALGDPDVFLPTDAGTRRALASLGVPDDPADLAERWRPWRSYAQMHLWQHLHNDTGPSAHDRG